MSSVDNSPNAHAYQTEGIVTDQYVATSAVLPTRTFDTNRFDLGAVRINGALATVTTDYTVSSGVVTPVGATAGEVFTLELVSKLIDKRPV